MGDNGSGDEDLRVLWDREAEPWARWARTPGLDVFFRDYNLPAFLEILPPPQGLLIEVGCGEGRVGRALRELGHRVLGVDGSPFLARLAREGHHTGGFPTAAADASALPITSGRADQVISFMCLQDVDDLEGAVREIERVLRPGGVCCIAILHPFDTAGGFDDHDEFRLRWPYPVASRYEDAVELHGIEMTFRGWHRPIATYLNAIVHAGLVLEEIREPTPTEELRRTHPRLERQRWIPAWLHIRARKPSNPAWPDAPTSPRGALLARRPVR